MRQINLLTLALAIALVIVCIRWAKASNSTSSTNHEPADSAVISNIMTRTSIRSYKDKPVEKEKVQTLLRAAMAAPSAIDKRPWHFVVVDDRQTLESIARLTPNASMAAEAPLAIVVCGDMSKAADGANKDFWIQDVSAATENILLAAHALGLGAVWTGTVPRMERAEKIGKLLHLPEKLIAFCTIVIGYPDEQPAPKDKWDESNVSYNTYQGKALATQKEPVAATGSFKAFDVRTAFRDNPFSVLLGDGMLLAAGDKSGYNAMTIGWGNFGNLWGQPTVTVYVAPKRYTHKFIEQSKYFTVMAFDKAHANVLQYMGSHSGRDGDKAKALGLHTKFTEHGAPYFEEATMVLECETMYHDQFRKENMGDVPTELYSDFPAGVHSFYIGRVIKAMKR